MDNLFTHPDAESTPELAELLRHLLPKGDLRANGAREQILDIFENPEKASSYLEDEKDWMRLLAGCVAGDLPAIRKNQLAASWLRWQLEDHAPELHVSEKLTSLAPASEVPVNVRGYLSPWFTWDGDTFTWVELREAWNGWGASHPGGPAALAELFPTESFADIADLNLSLRDVSASFAVHVMLRALPTARPKVIRQIVQTLTDLDFEEGEMDRFVGALASAPARARKAAAFVRDELAHPELALLLGDEVHGETLENVVSSYPDLAEHLVLSPVAAESAVAYAYRSGEPPLATMSLIRKAVKYGVPLATLGENLGGAATYSYRHLVAGTFFKHVGEFSEPVADVPEWLKADLWTLALDPTPSQLGLLKALAWDEGMTLRAQKELARKLLRGHAFGHFKPPAGGTVTVGASALSAQLEREALLPEGTRAVPDDVLAAWMARLPASQFARLCLPEEPPRAALMVASQALAGVGDDLVRAVCVGAVKGSPGYPSLGNAETFAEAVARISSATEEFRATRQ